MQLVLLILVLANIAILISWRQGWRSLAVYTFGLLVVTSLPAQAQNIALGKPVTASSVHDAGSPASWAVDGNPFTRWSSLYRDGESITVDLQATYAIARVKISWEAAYAKAYSIDVSADGSTWAPIYSTGNNSVLLNDLNIVGTGRYVRMMCTTRATPYGCSLFEFEVYGTAAVPAPVYHVFVPPMYPKPVGSGSDYKTDTINPRGKNIMANDSLLAYWYNDGFEWTCYGLAFNVENIVEQKLNDLVTGIGFAKTGDKSKLDAMFKANVNRFLTADEVKVRDDLCSVIPKQPLVYVVKANGLASTRPAYPRNSDGVLGTKKLGDVQVLTSCDCSSADKRVEGASLYCSVAGSAIVGSKPVQVFPSNAVSICTKQ